MIKRTPSLPPRNLFPRQPDWVVLLMGKIHYFHLTLEVGRLNLIKVALTITHQKKFIAEHVSLPNYAIKFRLISTIRENIRLEQIKNKKWWMLCLTYGKTWRTFSVWFSLKMVRLQPTRQRKTKQVTSNTHSKRFEIWVSPWPSLLYRFCTWRPMITTFSIQSKMFLLTKYLWSRWNRNVWMVSMYF